MCYNRGFTSWTCSRQMCSSCMMLSCQHGPKALGNFSSTLLNLCHELRLLRMSNQVPASLLLIQQFFEYFSTTLSSLNKHNEGEKDMTLVLEGGRSHHNSALNKRGDNKHQLLISLPSVWSCPAVCSSCHIPPADSSARWSPNLRTPPC